MTGDDLRALCQTQADFRTMPDKTIELPSGQQADQLSWTQDGNVLSVSTKQGALYSYLVKVPCMCAGWDSRVVRVRRSCFTIMRASES